MVDSNDYRELRNGKRYQTSNERIMSNHGSTEKIANRSSSQNVEEVPEFQTLTQEAVNEQIRGFISPLTRQLEELTRMVQGVTTLRHPNELGTTSGTAMPRYDRKSLLEKFLIMCHRLAIVLEIERIQNSASCEKYELPKYSLKLW